MLHRADGIPGDVDYSILLGPVQDEDDMSINASKSASLHRLWQKNFYPIVLWIIVLGTILIISLLYYAGILSRRSPAETRADKDNEEEQTLIDRSGSRTRPQTFLTRLSNAMLSGWRVIMYRCTVRITPVYRMTILELVFSASYLAVVLVLGLVDSSGFQPRAYANRCGHLATSQIPLIVGLAGKNNVISFLTGIGPEKLNVLHRASGRATLILAIIHGYGRWTIGLTGKNALNTPKIIWGITALTAFSLATIMSVRPLRSKAYEIFLVLHIILIFIYILAVSLHRARSWNYVVLGWTLWASDRITRLMRLIILNRLWGHFNLRQINNCSAATIEALSDDTLRITARRQMTWKAGQHAYLIMPTVSALPFEAHPFTIASVPENNSQRDKDLVFIVRARDGFTRRLLARTDGGSVSVPALVDGPYGCPPSLRHFSTVVLISGGSGVSYTLPQFVGILHDAKEGRASVQCVSFVWVVRHSSHITWISSTLMSVLSEAPSSLEVSIRIYLTRDHGALTSPSSESIDSDVALHDTHSADVEPTKLEALPCVSVLSGRPDMRALLAGEVDRACGAVSVDVCGPSSLTGDVRDALSLNDIAGPSAVMRGAPNVTLHVETFGW